MLSQRESSDRLFNKTIKSFEGVQKDVSKSTNQREWMCQRLRKGANDLSISLASESNEIAFSKHGSKYERTFPNKLNDIDVYVCFNGSELIYGTQTRIIIDKFLGTKPNRNIARWPMPFRPSDAKKELDEMLKIGLWDHYYDNDTILPTKRGFTMIIGKRTYDIIPSFVFYKNDFICHLIPSKDSDEWEINPTEEFLKTINTLNFNFSRETERKVLSFKDIIRLIKIFAKDYEYQFLEITSFMIKCSAITHYQTLLREQRDDSLYNHKNLVSVLSILNDALRVGHFYDPIEKQKKFFKRNYLIDTSYLLNSYLG